MSKRTPHLHARLGNIAKRLRNQRGESQRDVARALGIAQSTYCDFEKGEVDLRVSTLERLSSHFGRTPESLIRSAGRA